MTTTLTPSNENSTQASWTHSLEQTGFSSSQGRLRLKNLSFCRTIHQPWSCRPQDQWQGAPRADERLSNGPRLGLWVRCQNSSFRAEGTATKKEQKTPQSERRGACHNLPQRSSFTQRWAILHFTCHASSQTFFSFGNRHCCCLFLLLLFLFTNFCLF
jgi:hypothetical protein